MLLQLRSPATAEDSGSVRALAAELGYAVRVLDTGGRIVELERLGNVEPPRPVAVHRSLFEDLAAVQAVLEHDDAPELTARARKRAPTVVRAVGAAFGDLEFAVVAGPCAVEDEARLIAIARAVRDGGAALLRGGAFKPRTSPHSFQGLGRRALAMLAAARDATGLGIVTEPLDPRQVEEVAGVADVLQIGSRSMSNAALLVEAGRSGKPVLLKRGMAATVREFLLAAEHVLAQGNENVVLCERGVRGFDKVTRNVLDVGTVAYLKKATHLPVVVDPSHAAGRPDLVLPLAKAGVVAGADGLLIEVHPEPSEARSDGAQALSLGAFARLVETIRPLVELEGKRFGNLAREVAR